MKKVFAIFALFILNAVIADKADGHVFFAFGFCLFTVFAGVWNGYMDAHTMKGDSVLSSFLRDYMLYQEDAWLNKYKANFAFSQTFLVQFTSVWYYAKWWMLVCISIAAAFAFNANVPNKAGIFIALMFGVFFALGKEIGRTVLSKYKDFLWLNKLLFFPLLISQKKIKIDA